MGDRTSIAHTAQYFRLTFLAYQQNRTQDEYKGKNNNQFNRNTEVEAVFFR
jgi:hypothetical protein